MMENNRNLQYGDEGSRNRSWSGGGGGGRTKRVKRGGSDDGGTTKGTNRGHSCRFVNQLIISKFVLIIPGGSIVCGHSRKVVQSILPILVS